MSEPLRVTDLEEFSLDHIWRPYWPAYDREDLPRPVDADGHLQRLTKAPRDLDGTANALTVDDRWRRLVIGRLGLVGVDFPTWMRHQLVDVVREGIADWQFAQSIPADLDARKAEAKAAVRDQAWEETTSDEEEVERLRSVLEDVVGDVESGDVVDAAALRAAIVRPVKRRIVHAVAGCGADWNADSIIAAIDRATVVTWRRRGSLMYPGHQLVISGDPQTFNGGSFAVGVKRPEPIETPVAP